MTITIFGASGRTGKHLVRRALERGYFVKAFVRKPSRLPIQNPKLAIVEGDMHVALAVEQAIAGSDAVLSALGWTRTSRKNVLSEAAKNIVRAMKKHNVRRIIVLTGYGVRFPQDPPDSASKKFLHFFLGLFLPHLVPDGIEYAKIISESGLDWTIVRASILSNAKARGSYRAGYFDPGLRLVSREDVADFMIRQLTDEQYIGEAPIIGYLV
jgi:putative NADH-flavin reductase